MAGTRSSPASLSTTSRSRGSRRRGPSWSRNATPSTAWGSWASPPDPTMDTGLRPPPLDGIRVLEMGSFVAGPFAGQILGDLGADVVKIEPPGQGDPMRRWGITIDGRSLWWPALGRNKRSVAVDLRTAEGCEVVRR